MHHLSGVTNFVRWEWITKEWIYDRVVVEQAAKTAATQVSQMQASNKLKLDGSPKHET